MRNKKLERDEIVLLGIGIFAPVGWVTGGIPAGRESVHYAFGYGERRATMEDAGVGWIAAIIIGGLAGWLAEQFMKSNLGLLMNIVLGIVGAIVANALLGLVGVSLGGWIGYLIAGFIGACILIAIGRMFRR
jgi:uncharacterized membrane protein YeaQ/YmgE (transglycosylase-associated protein family)